MTDPDLTITPTLTRDVRDWLMEEVRYPVLAVTNAEGVPAQSVMCFNLDPEHPDILLMTSATRGLPYEGLQNKRRASLAFESERKLVVLEGIVELESDPERVRFMEEASVPRYGLAYPNARRAPTTIRLRVERVVRHS